MYKIGDIVVAKTTHKGVGINRGDTLRIDGESYFSGDFVAVNLTRGGRAYIDHDCFRGKKIVPENNAPLYEITLFGIPLFKVRKGSI
ncbi:hypothetical protein NGI46_08020 [Peribacillus butanolivorans]|uniref:hypothetical protein n=1 Tax=Peribacillus butanolivorans TaxID=421767 RepID=UPI00207D544B|nr:hypothetical protein [Peribacillus butanolivorans]MCO0597413.1 hypothetical protein [Peribacillus butanolivorans]